MERTIRSVEHILAEAVEVAPTERQAFVEKACAGNATLRAQVERLLANHDQAGSFLEHPVMVLDTVAMPASPEAPGTAIGPYKLLEVIGEGGMGVVYLAEQRQPLRRQVALKVIKPGMDSKQVVARFEVELQALALMGHPNIAKVLDAGITETGRPYFVMELIRGIAITDYCDQARLTVRQRLEVFIQVCRAVQHAHTKGVIHRDLKPSNVLVTSDDGVPVPKVIDFGVAKALEQPLTERTLHTGFGQMIGTPLYMSPEQAEFNLRGVDTRSDIYSLGVLLYELLTGVTPFDLERLRAVDFDELRRIIREEEPPRPSTRVSTLGATLVTVLERRGMNVRKLRESLHGELDWIVLKALEKDRARRYETASAFALDVQRYLNDEAVEACPPSAAYRLKKLARRHKGGLAVATGVLVLVAVLAGSVGWVIGERAVRRAEAEGQVAVALEVAEAKLVLGNPHDRELVTAARKAEAQLASGLVGEDSRRQIEQVLADLGMLAKLEQIRLGQTAVKDGHFDMAGADAAYAEAFRSYGIDVEAMALPEGAAQIRQRTIAIHLAAALDNWALAQSKKKGQRQRLLQVAQAADPDPWRCSLRQALAAESGGSAALEKLAASAPLEKLAPVTLVAFGKALRNSGATPSAVNVLRKAQQLYPGDFWINHDLGTLLAWDIKPLQVEEAIGFYRAALALRCDSPGVHHNLGLALQVQGRLDNAITCYQEAIRLKKDYAETHYQLGHVLRVKGRRDDAIVSFQEAIRLKKDNAGAHYHLGLALQDKGRLDDAITCYREAIKLKPDYAKAYCNLGQTLKKQGQFADALVALKRGHELGSQNPGWTYSSAQWVRHAERLAELDAKLPQLLKGETKPANAEECLEIAYVCLECKMHYVAAVRFFEQAFAAQPGRADDLRRANRYDAACAAALAGCGQGKDAGHVDAQEGARLRKQALDWLRADLTAWRNQLEKDKKVKVVVQKMQHWLDDTDFNGVRGAAALAKMPEAERGDWQRLWDEVAALRQQTQPKEK